MQIVRNIKNQMNEKCEINIDIHWEGEENSPNAYSEKDYGLAVDIGTTTIVMFCYKLQNKEPVGSCQEMNSQCMMGSDVVMRLMHCLQGKQKTLQSLVIEQLEKMAKKICKDLCDIKEIKKMTVVGNATMCHIFAGKDAVGLAGSPFRTAYEGIFRCKGESLGFRELSRTDIVVLPGIKSHVGADTTAMMACIPIQDSMRTHIAIDIGTNAEIVLHHDGEDIVCSTPAGPALEGMEISDGMRGVEGAISGVKIASQTGNIILDVIGEEGTKPIGICGSGLVDAVAQLFQCGLIQKDGYLLTAKEAREKGILKDLIERLEEDAFVLYQPQIQCYKTVELMGAPGQEGDCMENSNRTIRLTRDDIRQFQLAKASVQAGIKMLLSSREISIQQVSDVWLAGEFGKHISKINAIKTGMFPKEWEDKIHFVGNVAGVGVSQALLDEEFCLRLEKIAFRTRHFELAESNQFQQEFLEAMQLGE